MEKIARRGTTVAIIFLSLFLVVAIISMETKKEENFSIKQREKLLLRKYDSLQQQLQQQRGRIVVLTDRIDSISGINMERANSIDSLNGVIKKYQNPYTNHTAKELGDLMNSRARK